MRRLVLAAAVALTACAQPYDSPAVFDEIYANGSTTETPAQGFAGLDDLAQLSRPDGGTALPLRVLWTHGICTPPEGNDADNPIVWWQARTADLLVAYPGASLSDKPAQTEQLPAGARLIKEWLTVPGRGGARTIELWFFDWSPLTVPFKPRKIGDIEAGKGNSYRYDRASLNTVLKQGLVKDCFADVVVYLGRNGDAIRSDAQIAVCELLDGKFDKVTGCAGASAARYTAVISESIGSSIVFDAFRSLRLDYVTERKAAIERLAASAPRSPPAPRGDKSKPRNVANPDRSRANAIMGRARENSAEVSVAMASLTSFYMLANQLPLLNFADNKSWDDFMLGATERRKPGEGAAALTMVAFIDPNDLVAFRLIPKSDRGRIVNFVVSNADTYFGYAELPNQAHCNYVRNGYVMHAIVFGYAGGTPQSGPVNEPEKCL